MVRGALRAAYEKQARLKSNFRRRRFMPDWLFILD